MLPGPIIPFDSIEAELRTRNRELAEAHPEVICHLHRGLVEGFVEEHGGAGVAQFGTLVDREPCQVVLSTE